MGALNSIEMSRFEKWAVQLLRHTLINSPPRRVKYAKHTFKETIYKQKGGGANGGGLTVQIH